MMEFSSLRVIFFSVIVSLLLYLPSYSQDIAYITDFDGDDVCVVDLDANTEIEVIQVCDGCEPYWIAASSDKNLVAASLHDDTGVALIDPETMTHIGNVAGVGEEPEAIAVNSTGTLVYVADEGNDRLYVVDVATEMVIAGPIELDDTTDCDHPENMVITPDDSTLYITCEDGNTVVSVATTGFAVTDIADSGEHGIAINPTGTLLYYGDGSTVIEYSIATGLPTDTEYDGCRMYNGAISPSGDRLYCVDEGNELFIYETSSGNLIQTVDLTSGFAYGVAVGCEGAFAYVPIDDTLNVVNTATFDVSTIDLTCKVARDIVILCEQPPPPPAQVPTLSEWGLIVMAGILGIVGFMFIRRRKLTA